MKFPQISFQAVKAFAVNSAPFFLILTAVQMVVTISICGLPFPGFRYLGSIIDIQTKDLSIPSGFLADFTSLASPPTTFPPTTGPIITAASDNLADTYEFYLFNLATVTNGQRVFARPRFNYVDRIELRRLNTTVPIPRGLVELKESFARKIRVAQFAFSSAVFHATVILAVGLFAWLSKRKVPAFVFIALNFFALISFFAFALFATIAAAATQKQLDVITQFGVSAGISVGLLLIAWAAALQALPALVMWFLMAVGKTPPHPFSSERKKNGEFEELEAPKMDAFALQDMPREGPRKMAVVDERGAPPGYEGGSAGSKVV